MAGTLLHARKKTGEFERERRKAKAIFLAELSNGHAVHHSAQQAGVSRNTVYAWRDQDPEFLKDWEEAHENRGDWYEERLHDIAEEKNPTGIIVGLKMHKRFIEERQQPIAVGDTYNVQVNVINALSLLIAEADARFPGVAAFWEQRATEMMSARDGK